MMMMMFHLLTNIKNDRLMVSVALFLATAIFLLLLQLSVAKWSRQKQPCLPPGPAGLPILGCLPFLEPDLHRYFAGLAKTYGHVFSLRLGTKLCVVLSSPDAVREALKENDIIFASHDPPAVARSSRFGCNDLMWSPYGPQWRMLRKVIVQEILSAGNLEALASLRRREVQRTMAGVWARAGQPAEVPELMFLTSLNVMTSMLWGMTVEREGEDDIRRELRTVVQDIIEMMGSLNISDFVPALEPLDLQGLGKKMKQLTERYEGLIKGANEQRSSSATSGFVVAGKKTFLEVMLELVERRDPKVPLTLDHVGGLLLNMVAGGTDTTSVTVEWAMAELLRRPAALKKAQEELDSVVGRERVVEESDLSKLVYLKAIVKETLRLHPVAPLLVPYLASSPCTISGYSIPKGTKVLINVWAIQRDPSIWVDASEFKPERFIEAKYDYNGNDLSYIPFGTGRRICTGIALGERMTMYMLASLLHSFDWRLPSGGNGGREEEEEEEDHDRVDMTEKFGIIMKKAEPLRAIPVARLAKPELYS